MSQDDLITNKEEMRLAVLYRMEDILDGLGYFTDDEIKSIESSDDDIIFAKNFVLNTREYLGLNV